MSQAFSSGCANGTTGAMGATSTEGIGGLGRAAEGHGTDKRESYVANLRLWLRKM